MKDDRAIKELLSIKGRNDFVNSLLDLLYSNHNLKFEKLSAMSRMVVSLNAFEQEISSGGYYTWLTNEYGSLYSDLYLALDLISAQQTLKIIDSVAKRFPECLIPSDDEKRISYINDLQCSSNNFDEFAKEDEDQSTCGEDLIELLRCYLNKNIEKIIDAVEFNRNNTIVVKESTDLSNLTDAEKMRMLFDAIDFHDELSIKAIAASKFDINTIYEFTEDIARKGLNALHYCIIKGCCDSIIKTLVECGADVNCKSHKKWTPLFYAKKYEVFEETDEIMKYLIEKGARIEPNI